MNCVLGVTATLLRLSPLGDKSKLSGFRHWRQMVRGPVAFAGEFKRLRQAAELIKSDDDDELGPKSHDFGYGRIGGGRWQMGDRSLCDRTLAAAKANGS